MSGMDPNRWNPGDTPAKDEGGEVKATKFSLPGWAILLIVAVITIGFVAVAIS